MKPRFGWLTGVGWIFLVLLALVTLLRPGRPDEYEFLHNILQFIAPLFAGVTVTAYALRGGAPSRILRAGWLGIGLSAWCWAAGQLAWTVLESGLGQKAPFPGWPDVGFLCSYPFLLGGVLLLFGRIYIAERVRLLLDGLITAGSFSILFWYFIIQQLWKPEIPLFERLLGVAYPLGDLAILFAALLLFFMTPGDRRLHRSMRFLSAGIALLGVADTAFIYSDLKGTFQTGGWFDSAWPAGWMCIGMAVLPKLSAAGGLWSRDENVFAGTAGGRRRIVVPYTAAAGALLFVVTHDILDGHIQPGIFALSMFLMGLIILHQVLLQIENRRLNMKMRLLNEQLKGHLSERNRQMLALGREMEERKRMENELHEHRRHLEDLIQQRTAQYQEVNRRLLEEIGDKQTAQEALQAERNLFMDGPVVVFKWAATEGWPLEYVSPNIREQFGYALEDFQNGRQTFTGFIHAEDLPRILAEVKAHADAGATSFGQDYRVQCADHSCKWVRDYTRVIRNATGDIVAYHGYLQDITEQRNLQDQLVQSRKLETVGRLASGIAHDFNNVLTIINGYCDLLRQPGFDAGKTADCIQEIQKAGKRGAALTYQLRAFSRSQVLNLSQVNLNRIIANIERMLKVLAGDLIHLTLRLDPGLPDIRVDAGQIEQVIINLVVNAADAMPKGGELTLQTSRFHRPASDAGSPEALEPGPYVRLVVHDTGTGMDKAALSHLFEPFFTTKPKGKGVGLGLATAYGIIRQSHGSIAVESAPEHGTDVIVLLPAVKVERAPAEETDKPADIRPGHGERILVAEDEKSVLTLVGKLLTQKGYRVLLAASGEEALDMGADHAANIDLLLTDVMMPGINGLELAHRFAARRPSLKVVYMSGYPEEAMRQYNIAKPLKPFLHKPFTHQELLRVVQQALHAAAE